MASEASQWMKSNRKPGEEKLRLVTHKLRRKLRPPPSPEEMTNAFLEAMRQNTEEGLCNLIQEVQDKGLLEVTLTAAWCEACALNLQMTDQFQGLVIRTLVRLRYDLTQEKKDEPREQEPLEKKVNLLVDDAQRLQYLLGEDSEEADEAVMLAKRVALAISAVKTGLLCTYEAVPWEEMEFLLSLFVETHTTFRTLAFLVTEPERIRGHLTCFLESLESEKVTQLIKEKTQEELKKKPKNERANRTVRSSLSDILEDFTMLRDWYSIRESLYALQAASAALVLSQDDWKAWGWLALRGGLFVAGEKMKYTWTSPNLSKHHVRYFERLAPEGIQRLLRKGIRDVQAHSSAGTNADALTMSSLNTHEERNRLRDDLQRALVALEHMIRDAEQVVVRAKITQAKKSEYSYSRLVSAIRGGDRNKVEPVYTEVIKILEGVERFAEIAELQELVRDLQLDLSGAHVTPIQSMYFSKSASSFPFTQDLYRVEQGMLDVRERILRLSLKHCPSKLERIHDLLVRKSSEGISSFQNDLNIPSRLITADADGCKRALSALRLIPIDIDINLWHFAVESGLRELVSRQQFHSVAPPLLEPHAPALFGRKLRNYLNHGDQTVRSCFPWMLEEAVICVMLQLLGEKALDVTLNGALPSLRDTRKSSDRQLELSRLKDEMFRAARCGDLGGVLRVAAQGVEISSRNCQNQTLLHIAAKFGQADLVDWLLEGKATDPLALDWNNRSALHGAATVQVAKSLLNAGSVTPRPGFFDETTPLHSAAYSGRTEVLSLLLDAYDINEVYPVDSDRDSGPRKVVIPLNLAAVGGQDKAVRLLLQAGARYDVEDPTRVFSVENEANSPLFHAAISGSVETVNLFLHPPPPLLPQPLDDDCWVAADEAAFVGHEDVCCALLEELHMRNARIDCEAGRDAVLSVTKTGSIRAALKLLRLWPEAVGLSIGNLGCTSTMLHTAAGHGHTDLVRLLLEHGGDLLREDIKKYTALHSAASTGAVQVIDVLHKHTEQIGWSTGLRQLWEGRKPGSPLCIAALYGRVDAAQRLVELGADKNAGDHSETPLHLASREGEVDMVRWLVGQGVPLHGAEGTQSPLMVAAEFGNAGVVEALLPPPKKLSVDEQRACLALLQHRGPGGSTALHYAIMMSQSLEVTTLLVEREVELASSLVALNSELNPERFTLYSEKLGIPLLFCMLNGPASVARVLLTYMEDERVMSLGGEKPLSVGVNIAAAWVFAKERQRNDGMIEELRQSIERMTRWYALWYLIRSTSTVGMTLEPITRMPEDSKEAPVFLIPGIDGTADLFGDLCAYIYAPTLVLQLPHNGDKKKKIQDFAQSVHMHIKPYLAPGASFRLVGYSFGGMVSIELVRLLEQDGHLGQLILLDGAPADMKELTKVWTEDSTSSELESDVLVRLWFLADDSTMMLLSKRHEVLSKQPSRKERVNYINRKLKKSKQISESTCVSLVNRIKAINDYKLQDKLRSTVTLIRPTEEILDQSSSPSGLTSLFEHVTSPVHFVEGDTRTMLKNEKTAAIINHVLGINRT